MQSSHHVNICASFADELVVISQLLIMQRLFLTKFVFKWDFSETLVLRARILIQIVIKNNNFTNFEKHLGRDGKMGNT